jgi:hypothetical protein
MTKSSKNKNCVIKTLDAKKPPKPKVLSPKGDSDEIQLIKSKINDACNFPKTLNYQNKDIYVDVKKLTSNVRKIETLT